MKDIYANEFDGYMVVTMFSDTGFEDSFQEGDFVNVTLLDGTVITCGKVVLIYGDGTGFAVKDGKDSVICCFFPEQTLGNLENVEKVYPVETEPVHYVHAVTRGGITCRDVCCLS